MNQLKWKGPVINKEFIFTFKGKNNFFFRNNIVVPKLLNSTLFVYNGKKFLKITVNENMLGYKLGSFSFTRKKFTFKKTKKIKK